MSRALSWPIVGLAIGALTACVAGDVESEAPDIAEGGEDELRGGRADGTLPAVDAASYAIALVVEDVPGHETFRGDVKGTYTATEELAELILDFEGNTIDDVTIGGRRVEFRRDGPRLRIELPARIGKGKTFSTRIKYHGDVAQADGANPNDFSAFGGFQVKQRNPDGKRIYSSLSWPSKARRWLPVRDHPRDGAAVSWTLTFPKAFTVLANGKSNGATENADGTKTWRYEAETPMPVYDFHVSAYDDWKVDEQRSQSGVPISTYTYAGAHARAKEVYRDLSRVLDFYEGAYGKYRWGTAGFIEEPIFGGGMEHAGVVSMDETLFDDPAGARETAFHELAHHWSGNLVRIRRWNDFWLSEGFTEYLTARAIGAVDGPEAGKDRWRSYLARTLSADDADPHALAPKGKEVDVLGIFDAISYQKGALVVRMLERIVGEAKMTEFLKGWFDRHAFGAVTTEDFERELSEASGRDLSKFFASFVYAGYHPELRVTFAAAGDETEVTVEQLQSRGPEGGFLFPLDLDLVAEGGQAERVTVELGGKTTTQRLRLAHPPRSVVVDPDETAIATQACGRSGDSACHDRFRCAPRGALSVCVPR